MAEKDRSKKKKIVQDLMLDDFFKPPAEESKEEPSQGEKPKEKKGAGIKKDLLLDDFFKSPVEEEEVKESPSAKVVSPPRETKQEKIQPPQKTLKPEVTKPPSPPPEPTILPPPGKSLKELLEEPLFEEKKEVYPTHTPTPHPFATPSPIKMPTPAPQAWVAAPVPKKFPAIPALIGAIIVISIAIGAFLIFRPKEQPPAALEEKPKPGSMTVEIPKPQPVQEQAPTQTPQQEPQKTPPLEEKKIDVTPSQVTATHTSPEQQKQPPPQVAKVNKFFVEAGPYNSRGEAKAGEVKVKILGFKSEISTTTTSGKLYNLFVEKSLPPGEAKITELKLKIKGFSPELMEDGENMKVKIGSYSSIQEAIENKTTVSELGYNVTIDIQKKPQKSYFLKIGFPEENAAKEAVDKLKGLGIDSHLASKGG